MELKIGSRRHLFSKPQVMGVVNITPDSFYTKSRHTTVKEVFATIEKMIEEGVDIVDLGAASSHPGATPLSGAQEWARLTPILEKLRLSFPETIFSIDTWHSGIVERAYNLIGPFIVNDISGGMDDPRMFEVAARRRLPVVAMHKRGTSQTMQHHTDYDDVVSEVRSYFTSSLARAREVGVSQVILDPGFGFAKTMEQNYELLSRLPELFLHHIPESDGPEVLRLIGISRKSMIYKPLEISADEALPATSALHLFALQHGVDILRVHDVAQAVQVVRLYSLLNISS
ncbi:MAG: dihydropteroate synthase [Bacteroidales bacterium]|nr:dihydropteroate synthase [Bacteroidales bacterium]